MDQRVDGSPSADPATTRSENQASAAASAPAWKRVLFSASTAAVLATFFWGAGNIVVRDVRLEVPPMGLAFWRMVAAAVLFLPFTIGPLIRQRALVRKHWKILALLSLLLMVGGNAVLFLALQYTIAINAAVVNAVEPVFILILAWLFYRDPILPRQWLGVAVAMAGMVTLISAGSLANIVALDFNPGDILVIFAYLSWSLYAIMMRKVPRELDHRVVLFGIIGFAVVFMLPIYLAETILLRPMPVSWTAAGATLWLAVTSTVLAILMWNYTIRQMGPGRAGLYLYLIPVFTVVLAIVLLGETMHSHHYAGIALIAVGIVLSELRRRKRA